MYRDQYFMKMALRLAEKGKGRTSPNPLVGAVLVKDGKVISSGYHKRFGSPHAEAAAIKKAGKRAEGSTLYVNLEPCNHFGKTPPCTKSIIESGIKRVVAGMQDPNPINDGKGLRELRRNNIRVRCGVLKAEARRLNKRFEKFMREKRPYVTVKVAQSIDGKIATFSGDSKWISNAASRRFVHKLRAEVDAILIGSNTAVKDNPLLTARRPGSRKQPVRIVLDSRLKISVKSRLIKSSRSSKVIVATTRRHPAKKAAQLRRKGIDVTVFTEKNGMVDLRELLRYLAGIGISNLLVEGGGNAIASFLDNGLADEMLVFVSPRIIGGRDSITSVEGNGRRLVNNAVRLENITIKRFREDILIKGHVHGNN